jgi:HAD superfamily hydrolase (TIGR01549 family)
MTEPVPREEKPTDHIEAIVFDAFGTLIDYPVRLHPYRRLLRMRAESGAGDHDQTSRRLILTSLQTPAQLARSSDLEDELPAILSELGQEIAAMRLYPDVFDTMGRLREAGYRVGVCSNLGQAYGDIVRALLGDSVDVLVLSFEVGFAKPEQAIFQHLSERLAVSPRATLFIGDSLFSDVEGARRAGMLARQIQRGRGETLEQALRGFAT